MSVRIMTAFKPLKVASQSIDIVDSDTERKTAFSASGSIHVQQTPPLSISCTQLRKIFDKFDYNKTGTLNISEFSSACYCVIGPQNLAATDILSIFQTIDNDHNGTICFDEFCEFIEPSNRQKTNNISQAFASMSQQNLKKYPSLLPLPSSFKDDYESRFWSRDMGVILLPGNHGINAYIQWRFTYHARTHIRAASKIIGINDKNMNGLLFEEIIAFLNIVIITTEGFRVKFRPKCKLKNDRYLPSDFRILTDEIEDVELLKPKFDRKKLRARSLKKLLTSRRNVVANSNMLSINTETSMVSATTTSIDFGINHEDSMFEHLEDIKIPQCWFKCPRIIRKMLCVKQISRMSELKRYGTHCRHCPLKIHKCRTLIHNLLDNEKYSKLSYAIQVFIMTMILISTLSYIIETLPVFNDIEVAQKVFLWIEYIVSVIFTVEYLLRIIAARNICVFFWDMLNLIDFAAIIPFWIEWISGAQGTNALRVIRVIRLARVFRLMKSPRFAEYIEILHRTLVASMGSFGLFLTLIFLEIIVTSSLVYVCEQSIEATTFTSIPTTSWWAFVTVTTIGYGDMVPQSPLGRIICVFTLFSGLLVIALPVIIIGGNFNEEYSKYISHKAGWSATFDFKGNENKKQQIFTIARLLHFINNKQCRDIFEWKDVKYLYDQGLDSLEIINKILSFDHGHCYLPKQFSSYKKYALFEFYGKKFRKNNREKEQHRELRRHERQTKSQPPPSPRHIGKYIAGLIRDTSASINSINESSFKETDTLLLHTNHNHDTNGNACI